MALPGAPSLATRALAGFVRLTNARSFRRATKRLGEALLTHQRWLPGERIESIATQYAQASSTCCEKGSAHNLFAERFLREFGERTTKRARDYLRDGDPKTAGARLDAWVRMALVGELRGNVLFPRRGREGVPTALLHQAQLALYPHCDLGCEGCFTEEDRVGRAPSGERIAWLVDEADACGAGVIHVVGKGEPFLSPTWANELLSVLEARPHLFFTLATHGMHVTREQADRLAMAGNVLLLVSVDGPAPIHDARRGAGSYARVMNAMDMLRERGAHFGYSCMVSSKSHHALASGAFVQSMTERGCSIGVHSRYFPLAAGRSEELALSPAALAEYRAAFERVKQTSEIPLLDLDDVEQHSGCHSRTGESVYIDGITGAVTPCLRVPFGPADCRVDPQAGLRLADALEHPYFVEYRARTGPCPSWCGADLAAELTDVQRILAHHGGNPERLDGYLGRSPSANGDGRRRLPIAGSTP